jgi:hypothetical protein
MPRVDLFTAIHKGIRSLVYHQASALQATDFSDATEAQVSLSDLEHTLELLHEHSAHEEHFIFSELRRFEPGLVEELEGAHKTIARKIASAQAAATQTQEAAAAADKLSAGAELNRRFNELVAFSLSHNNDEERRAVAATTGHFPDEQLVNMRAGIQAGQTPERAAEWAGWMLPSLSGPELAGLPAGARASVPPPVFAGMVQVARGALGEERRQKAAAAEGL